MLVDHENIGPDTPLRLEDAVRHAFPAGGITVSGLRKEVGRSRLQIEIIAGKQFTTLRAIERMRGLCRVKKEQDSDLSPRPTPQTEDSAAPQIGSSETDRARSALAALNQRDEAERKLAEHIGGKYAVPTERNRHPSKVLILDVLNLYQNEIAPDCARPKEVAQRIESLSEWWSFRRDESGW